MVSSKLNQLLDKIAACTLCSEELPFGPRPIVQASESSRVLVVGQAPGKRVHETGIPFNDPSGDRLRMWMGLTRKQFYDDTLVALIPMGFCYPGTGKGGDLPPLKACAAQWRADLLACLKKVELILVIGQYAHDYHLVGQQGKNLTETVSQWRVYWPEILPMPHPSPRNNRWLVRNPWFEADVIPCLQRRMKELCKNL